LQILAAASAQVIEDDNIRVLLHEQIHKMTSDETGTTGYENSRGHRGQLDFNY
jgi:hypothetical protein